ncbi:MAG: hypothetical protein H0V83_09515 [Rubrobacter sp.]|nr:hypothetical protein [Rubrobacter sp.]
MSEGRRAVHPQEPAEGSEEDVEAPGIEESRDDLGTPDNGAEERSSAHPQEPAEGGDDQIDEPGAHRSGNAA